MDFRLRRLCWMLVAAVALGACGRDEVATPTAAPAAQRPTPGRAATPVADAGAAAPQIPKIDASQLQATLASAQTALAAGAIEQAGGQEPGALELFLAVLAIAPDDKLARTGLEGTLQAMIVRDIDVARSGNLAPARRTEKLVKEHRPHLQALKPLRRSLLAAQEAEALVEQAAALVRAGKVLEPKGTHAVGKYREALARFAGYGPALAGLERLETERVQRATAAAAKDDFSAAEALIAEAARISPRSPRVVEARSRLRQQRQARTDQQLQLGHRALDKLAYEQGTAHLTQAIALWPKAPGLEALRARIELARYYGAFRPGQTFTEILADGGLGPEMVVLPRGVLAMGSSEDAPLAQDHEKPQRQVRFLRGYAMSRNEITVADFRRFVRATGYLSLATRTRRSTVYDERGGNMVEHADVDWQRDHAGGDALGRQPVLHIAFEDALAYAEWLSRQTGQRYRLPTEAEWEYALRAGKRSEYPWGKSRPPRLVGNLTGDGDSSPKLQRRWGNPMPRYRDGFWGPAPVRSFPAEGFGTFDLIGNVAEWTQDCWHDSYRRAPEDGSAWVNPGCEERVVRGASWASAPEHARSAFRAPARADAPNARIGFRLVRDI